jgi:hypothetical protein
MSVDIEFPLPGDIVGPEFQAGGVYDIRELKKEKKDEKECRTIDLYRVVCTLYQEGGTMAIQQKMSPDSMQGVGVWDVTFSVNMNYTDCVIKAELQHNSAPTGARDEVVDVDIDAAADVAIATEPTP